MSRPDVWKVKPDLIVYIVDGGEGVGFVGWARPDFGGRTGILALMSKDHALRMAAQMEHPEVLIYEMATLLQTCESMDVPLAIQDGLGEKWLVQRGKELQRGGTV